MKEKGLVWLASPSGNSTNWEIYQDINRLIGRLIDRGSSGIFTYRYIAREIDREIDREIVLEKGLVLVPLPYVFDWETVTIQLDITVEYNSLSY